MDARAGNRIAPFESTRRIITCRHSRRIDTAHVSFLHNNRMGDRKNLFTRDGAPKIDVFETDYGYYYVSSRKSDGDQNFVRVYQYTMPFQQMRPNVINTGLSSNPSRAASRRAHLGPDR